MNTTVVDFDQTLCNNETIFHKFLLGLQPAFRHRKTGESHLAQCEPGVPSSCYGFAGLPIDWVVEWDEAGEPIALHPDIVAGYWRSSQFIDFTQISHLPLDA